jgi:ribosomal protein L31
MKKKILLYDVVVLYIDGTTTTIQTTIPLETLRLDTAKSIHQAWVGGRTMNTTSNELKFKNKYGILKI